MAFPLGFWDLSHWLCGACGEQEETFVALIVSVDLLDHGDAQDLRYDHKNLRETN